MGRIIIARNTVLVSLLCYNSLHAVLSIDYNKYVLSSATDLKNKYNIYGNNKLYFHLNETYKHTGVNWLQVKHALHYAICCKGYLEISANFEYFPKLSRYYDFTSYPNGLDCFTNDDQPNTIVGNFFTVDSISVKYPRCNYDDYQVSQLYVFKNSNTHGEERDDQQCPSDIENTLVVQIRSGEVFNTEPASQLFIQPPIAYYKHILNHALSSNIRKVIFSTSAEPKINPVWSYLIQYTRNNAAYRAIKFSFERSNNFDGELQQYFCARHFVGAMSSLTPFIVEASSVVRTYIHYVTEGAVLPGYLCRDPEYGLTCYRYRCDQVKFNWENQLLNDSIACHFIRPNGTENKVNIFD